MHIYHVNLQLAIVTAFVIITTIICLLQDSLPTPLPLTLPFGHLLLSLLSLLFYLPLSYSSMVRLFFPTPSSLSFPSVPGGSSPKITSPNSYTSDNLLTHLDLETLFECSCYGILDNCCTTFFSTAGKIKIGCFVCSMLSANCCCCCC